jgi:hypothetical protein
MLKYISDLLNLLLIWRKIHNIFKNNKFTINLDLNLILLLILIIFLLIQKYLLIFKKSIKPIFNLYVSGKKLSVLLTGVLIHSVQVIKFYFINLPIKSILSQQFTNYYKFHYWSWWSENITVNFTYLYTSGDFTPYLNGIWCVIFF